MTQTPVTLLIQLLQEIELDESIEVVDTNYVSTHPLVRAVVYLANQYLTGDDGYGLIQQIIRKGFNIYPGEQDRFGWLIGCIQLGRGVIVFG